MIREWIKEKTHLPIPVFLFIPDLEAKNDSPVGIEQAMQSPLRGRTPYELEVQIFSNSFPRCTYMDRKMSQFFYLIYSILLKGDNNHFYILILEIKRKSIVRLNIVHDDLSNFSYKA